MADDYGTMQTRIANELVRSDIGTEIQDAIKNAIAFYASYRFDFNEGRATRYTTSGTQYYSLPEDFIELDKVMILVQNNYTYPLEPRSYDWLLEHQSNTEWSNRPSDYAIFNDQLVVYPIPDDSYQLTLVYQKELSDLSASADTNAFMEIKRGEELIRTHAKIDLMENVIRGDAIKEAQILHRRLPALLSGLIKETTGRKTTDKIEATQW